MRLQRLALTRRQTGGRTGIGRAKGHALATANTYPGLVGGHCGQFAHLGINDLDRTHLGADAVFAAHICIYCKWIHTLPGVTTRNLKVKQTRPQAPCVWTIPADNRGCQSSRIVKIRQGLPKGKNGSHGKYFSHKHTSGLQHITIPDNHHINRRKPPSGNKPVRGTMLSPKLPAGRASQLF